MESQKIEDMISNLDALATRLESGETTLDEAIKCFEEGVLVAKKCFDELKQTSGKITMLKKEMDELIETPFNEE